MSAAMQHAIIAGEWRPGDMLSEGELARRYAVSRAPVREALAQLAFDGWIAVVPHRGYRVLPVRRSDLEEHHWLRAAIEPNIAAQVAANATAIEVAGLEPLITSPTDRSGIDEALHRAREFHTRLLTIAGNARAQRVVERALDEMRRIAHFVPSTHSIDAVHEEVAAHRRVLDAIRARDVHLASRAMAEHLEHRRGLIELWAELNE